MANIIGTDGNDTLLGTNSADTINGNEGNDSLEGGKGDDLLSGDAGNDTLLGGTDNDTLLGGSGNDNLIVGYSEDLDFLGGDHLLSGDDGNDFLSASGNYVDRAGITFYSSGNNTLNGGAGDDYLTADFSKGNNLLNGGDGNDTFSKTDWFSGNDDTIDGGKGEDFLLLSPDDYNITGGMTSTFNPTTNIRSITAGTSRVNYKNIERLKILGTEYDDLIVGSNGNDTLSGGRGGNDTIDGGIGDDFLSLTADSNATGGIALIDGGIGDDLLLLNDSNATGGMTSTFNPTTNIRSITAGTSRVNYKNIERLNISGTFYDDLIVGSNSNDTLSGGDGGNDTIDGGIGDDFLSLVADSNATGGIASIDGGIGDDLFLLNDSNATGGITSTFNATTNIGSITAGTSRVSYKNIERLNILGTNYDDNIVGSNGNDTFSELYGGNDTIDGGTGDDLLSYTTTDSSQGITSTFDATTNTGLITMGRNRVSYKNIERLNISGTRSDDNIVGSNGNDTIIGNALNEVGFPVGTIEFISGNDTIDGGKGDDLLIVHDYSGDDTEGITSTFNATTNTGSITAGRNRVIYKNIERLDIFGTYFDDLIVGSNGDDTINGSSGNDILIGGKGNDSLIGESGTDTFAFNSFNQGIDRLDDFNTTNELIQVSVTGFGGGLSPGSLKTSQFTLGASATTSTQRFIYNNITGALFFDQDGSANAFTQVKFAQLLAGLSLTKNNFAVV